MTEKMTVMVGCTVIYAEKILCKVTLYQGQCILFLFNINKKCLKFSKFI